MKPDAEEERERERERERESTAHKRGMKAEQVDRKWNVDKGGHRCTLAAR